MTRAALEPHLWVSRGRSYGRLDSGDEMDLAASSRGLHVAVLSVSDLVLHTFIPLPACKLYECLSIVINCVATETNDIHVKGQLTVGLVCEFKTHIQTPITPSERHTETNQKVT
jgi:hypothetical protein